MPDRIRVLLVDDHAMMRAGFRLILESEDDIVVVGEASTGVEAVVTARDLRPDVICMDVQMPDMDGLEATRSIVSDADVSAAVLIVTTFDRDDYLFAALSAGAAGFLLKNAGPEVLVRAVRVAAAGDALLSPEVTRRVIARFAGGDSGTAPATAPVSAPASASVSPPASSHVAATAPVSPPASSHVAASASVSPTASSHVAASALEGPPAAATEDGGAAPAARDAAAHAALLTTLTDREAEVLRLVAEALSNAEIAQRLFIGEATVKTHVSNVLAKLGARDRVQAVVLAYRHGLA
ncbi:response regulator transcription factor [Microbacterium terrisoli]|uniref:response regulator transcription factor n=1 Tax=Microbacterium terrisoli TaxID=3242192 RepID=UPI00280652BB|nr:response regulator transcription factor [Microbacterium protaetiae]